MADVLELVSFGLPPTFPPEAMPDAVSRFVAGCHIGMRRTPLTVAARRRGWQPSWKRLEHFVAEPGIEVYGFGLTVGGMVIPLMARMRRVKPDVTSPPAPPRDPRQLMLF